MRKQAGLSYIFIIAELVGSRDGRRHPSIIMASADDHRSPEKAEFEGEAGARDRNRYRKSATAAPSVTTVPVALPSSIFDFVLGTSPS